MIERTKDSFDDLSAVWLEAEQGNWFLCVQYEGTFASYSAWVSSSDDTTVNCSASSIEEAKEIAEAMYEQMLIDACGGFFGF